MGKSLAECRVDRVPRGHFKPVNDISDRSAVPWRQSGEVKGGQPPETAERWLVTAVHCIFDLCQPLPIRSRTASGGRLRNESPWRCDLTQQNSFAKSVPWLTSDSGAGVNRQEKR